MLAERFALGVIPQRHARFVEDLAELVLHHGGTLKAEHGTGRVMAPCVRRQYGDDAYASMREVKRLFDPEGVLNPGVVIGDDAQAHLRNLKVSPPVQPEVERCVECGYCEPEAFDVWASLNRPCEIAMTRATGRPYRHILELLAEATAPADQDAYRSRTGPQDPV
jgi:hypothetical protein